MELTIYSDNFDNYSYVVGRGMSGKIFVENTKTGKEFKTVSKALEYIAANNVPLNCITFYYQQNGKQLYKTYNIKNEQG